MDFQSIQDATDCSSMFRYSGVAHLSALGEWEAVTPLSDYKRYEPAHLRAREVREQAVNLSRDGQTQAASHG